jgi:hypothetical protein
MHASPHKTSAPNKMYACALAAAIHTSGVTLRAGFDGFGANTGSNLDPTGQLQRPVAVLQSPAALLSPHMFWLQLPAVMFRVTMAMLFVPAFATYV